MVRFDDGMRQLCRTNMNMALHVGDLCIVRFKHGQDYGRIIALPEKPVAEDTERLLPMVVRRATLQDQAKAAENTVHGRMAAATCRRRIEETKCEMHLLHARYNFDRSLLIVSFSAEERVDFRELIKILTEELAVQIEMRQVGVRDAARQIGGMASCGRTLCCHQWLRKFEAINVKMAKTQHVSLSSTSISGMCGRLKCCLRYEYDTYQALGRQIPGNGTKVETPEGPGIVVDRNLVQGVLSVRLDEHRVQKFTVNRVRTKHDQ